MATPYLPGHSGSLTYYNPFPTDPARAREHWLNYLSNATLAKYTADSIGRLIERSSREQLAALDEVNGTLQQGFAGVQGGLLAVADGVRGLTAEQARGNHLLALANAQLDGLNTGVEQANRTLSTIDSRLVLLVEQQHLSNVLQENMAELLRVPDEEKKRHADIKWGLKFCKDALRDPDLYHDGLKYLLQAERALPEDYFVLRQIGMLYLYAPPLLDLAQAREYLVKAAKYAAVDSHPDAERISHVLAKSLLLPFSRQAEPDAKAISRFAAETYRHAAQAHYNLGTFADALRLIGKAISLDPDDDELNFCKAKYLAAAGLSSEVLVVLRMLPETNNYVQKVLGDYDLANCGGPQWVTRVLAHRATEAKRLAEEWPRRMVAALRRSGMSEENVTRLLTQGGTVVAWGDNNAGQINVPAGLSGVTAIAAGGYHTVALKTDGTVVAWGAGGEGQSGHQHYGQTTVLAGLSGVVAIAATGKHTVALVIKD